MSKVRNCWTCRYCTQDEYGDGACHKDSDGDVAVWVDKILDSCGWEDGLPAQSEEDQGGCPGWGSAYTEDRDGAQQWLHDNAPEWVRKALEES